MCLWRSMYVCMYVYMTIPGSEAGGHEIQMLPQQDQITQIRGREIRALDDLMEPTHGQTQLRVAVVCQEYRLQLIQPTYIQTYI